MTTLFVCNLLIQRLRPKHKWWLHSRPLTFFSHIVEMKPDKAILIVRRQVASFSWLLPTFCHHQLTTSFGCNLKTTSDWTREGLARSIMMVWILNSSTDQIQRTNNWNWGHIHLIQATRVTNSEVSGFNVESAHAFKLVKLFLVTVHSMLVNGMIWQSAEDVLNHCLLQVKWLKLRLDAEVIKQHNSQKIIVAEVKRW